MYPDYTSAAEVKFSPSFSSSCKAFIFFLNQLEIVDIEPKLLQSQVAFVLQQFLQVEALFFVNQFL